MGRNIVVEVMAAAVTAAINNEEERTMKYVCNVCGWVYDEAEGYPEEGIAPGTKWEAVAEDFLCPLCAVGKEEFSEEE